MQKNKKDIQGIAIASLAWFFKWNGDFGFHVHNKKKRKTPKILI